MIQCPTCGEEKSHLGNHWRFCRYPPLSVRQREIVEGLVLGDGCVHDTRTNNFFTTKMANKRFLEWLDSELGIFSLGLDFVASGEELAKRNESNELFKNQTINPDNYTDMYQVQSRRHPYFNGLRNIYYSTGEKYLPDNLSPTPLMMKMWYISDGSLMWANNNRAGLRIGVRSEMGRKKYLIGLFDDLGFNVNLNGWNLQMGVDEAGRFLDYLGKPIPGYKYKWENTQKDRYKTLKLDATKYTNGD